MYALNRNAVSRAKPTLGTVKSVIHGNPTPLRTTEYWVKDRESGHWNYRTPPRPAPPPSQGKTGCRENLTRLVDGVT
jgi:hypothetical protein